MQKRPPAPPADPLAPSTNPNLNPNPKLETGGVVVFLCMSNEYRT